MPSAELPRDPSATSDLRVVEDPGVAVVLVCTTQDAPTITRYAIALTDVTAEILAGVERDSDLLRGRLLRAAAPTLFVLCKTSSLDGEVMRRAVEAFGARRALGHRLLVIEFAGERASSWLASIRRTRTAMARNAASSESRAAGVPGMKDCGVDELVRGETRSRRTTRVQEPTAAAPRVVLSTETATGPVDEAHPIPPHQRARSTRPHLSVVADDDDARASISDAELPQPVPVVPASESVVPYDASADVTRTEGLPPPRAGGRLAAAVVLVAALGCLAVAAALSPGDPAPMPAPAPAIAPAADQGPASSNVVVPPPPGPFAAAPMQAPPPPVELPAPAIAGPEASLDAVDWHRATNRCHARRDDAGRPMRLPNVDEAEALQRTAAIGVSLWTRSRSNRPDANWIVGAGGKRRSADKDDGLAHVLCVRDV